MADSGSPFSRRALPAGDGSTPVLRGGTSNDQLRRYNLSAVMTLVHRLGGVSRAELTRLTGLTRSAIGGLVAELTELGLVVEMAPADETGRVGRPSLQVMPDEHLVAIAVAPDSDAITVGLVGLGGEVIRRVRYDTMRVPSVADTVKITQSVIAGMQHEISGRYRVVGVGIAVPGLVASASGRVLLAPQLNWHDQNLTEPLQRALGYPVYAGNDASLGALAETHFGAARGVQNLVYLNGSARGIGGGLIIDGTAVRGTDGYAGELGHTLVNSAGIQCHCGRIGCLETEVNLPRLLKVLGLRRADQDELDVALGISRDPAVHAEVRRQIDSLSEAISNFVNLFNPEMVVLSGFLGSLLTVGRERLTESIRVRSMSSRARQVRIERAELRSRLPMVGAAEVAFAPILADPAGHAAPR